MNDDAWARANREFFATGPLASPDPVPATPQPVAPQPPQPPTPQQPVAAGAAWQPMGPAADGPLLPHEAEALATSMLQREAGTGLAAVGMAGRRLRFGEALEVGLNLARSSWTVVTRAPALLGVTAIAVVVGLALVVIYSSLLGGPAAMDTGGKLAVAVKAFPLLVLLAATGSVAQAVIVVVVRDMAEGRRASLSKGWAAAIAHLPQLVGFAVVFAGERTLTNMMRNSRGGKMAARAIDYTWDLATYLAIPVIMFEPGVGALSSVKRSAQLVRTRFGVTMVATGAIGLAVFVCAVPAFLLAALVGSMVSTTTAVVLVVIVLLTEMVVAATLQGVCSAVMYRYVTTGVVDTTFSEMQLMRVFGSPARPAMAY